MANLILDWILQSEGNFIGLFLMVDVIVSFLITCAIMSFYDSTMMKIRRERRRQARFERMKGNVVDFKKSYKRHDTAA